MDFEQALELLSQDERFKATVSAMNTLLIQKGIYAQKEFEVYFCQWAESETKKRSGDLELHPFVQGLLKTLPAEGLEWPSEDRRKWLQTAAGIFDLIFPDREGSTIKVQIENK